MDDSKLEAAKRIPFSDEMVRAVIDGRKTQTRRPMRVQPPGDGYQLATLMSTTGERRNVDKQRWVKMASDGITIEDGGEQYFKCPYGEPGGYLFGTEAWQAIRISVDPETGHGDDYWPCEKIPKHNDPDPITGNRWWTPVYRATDPAGHDHPEDRGFGWRPSIHMPKWASRLVLEITNVRVERVQDISEEDAAREGVRPDPCNPAEVIHMAPFSELWDSIYSSRGLGWDANPWVWALTFKVVEIRGQS